MSELFKKKLIFIEDNELARAIIMSKLLSAGYSNIAQPTTSIEGWELIVEAQLNNEPYDLVITDLNMPDFDGMDLISRIKEDPASASLKVIVISSDSDASIIKITKELGALAYLTKPIVTEELLGVVEAVLLDKEIPEVVGMFPINKVK